ncbi:MAG: VWA domain-containing protein [Planctomycetota bacterium]|nr:VWA domain-containing protein [Planctomycetota bacterium]
MMFRTILPAVCLAALLVPVSAQEVTPVKKIEPAAQRERVIDLCICLDVSGSMKGLIHSARSRIWSIVNDLALAKPSPRLRVALYSYGGGAYNKSRNYIRQETKFTEDLDLVSKRLFALVAAGSVEFVGGVMHRALTDLAWQSDANALKLMVVAGNETANQDPKHNYLEMARASIQRGVMVNSIFCGNAADVIAQEWASIAKLSDGHFAAIDQNSTVDISSPFDTQLADLSSSLNATYIAYGRAGKAGRAAQSAADSDAEKQSSNTSALRALSKSKKQYWNHWCLADALERKQVKLEDVKDKDLPEYMRGKTLDEKMKIVEEKRAARAKIKGEIETMSKKRREWMAAELRKRGEADAKSFDAVLRKALRAQATAKGYQFEK